MFEVLCCFQRDYRKSCQTNEDKVGILLDYSLIVSSRFPPSPPPASVLPLLSESRYIHLKL